MEKKDLKPASVFHYFEEICRVPRPSKKEEKIRNYLVDFAKAHALEYKVDEAGNVLISKSATAGMENLKKVVLQSHMDMVCEKNNQTVHNFETDPIETYIDGEWLKAKGTTLGADNGIGMATELAVLAADDIQHGPLECLFTVDEETGLTGAFALKEGFMSGDILINLDSEDEGELFIGCAGGAGTTAEFPCPMTAAPEGYFFFRVAVKGLTGGHSGDDINKNRANANKLMARFMNQVIAYDEACLVSWEGGNMRNAIPRECEVVITVPASEVEDVLAFVGECEQVWRDEFATIEDNISFTAERVDLPKMMVPEEIRDNLVDAIYACPNGVERFIPTIPDTVETSSNLAIVEIGNGKAAIKVLTRSSRESMKDYRNTAIESCFSMAGMHVERSGSYSGWEPDVNSPILHAMKESYKAQFGETPEVKVIHAGLECGIIGAVVPGLDMISFGPTLQCPHTPEERCHVPSVKKFYDFLLATLENTPKK